MDIYTPENEAIKLAKEILDNDPRTQSMDALNYACAVRDKAKAFISLDERLSNELVKKYGVKIIYLSKKRK